MAVFAVTRWVGLDLTGVLPDFAAAPVRARTAGLRAGTVPLASYYGHKKSSGQKHAADNWLAFDCKIEFWTQAL